MGPDAYIAIDLKSFYASVECVERGLDPLNANLVVADKERTDKTICLAATPSLKSYGIPGRARLFEAKQRVREANAVRKARAPQKKLAGSSYLRSELDANPNLAIDFIIARPRMSLYIEYSTKIYEIYMKYVAPEDVIVYSIDEVFINAAPYLDTYKLSPRDLAKKIIQDVLDHTGVTAAAGIGTNLYLCKVALDIVAKKIPADQNGVRIAQLDEASYRQMLWTHRPLTDFWRIGRGYAKKLEENGMFTMGDVARRSIEDEDLLYKLFGKNAELLIDHAWGWEPCTVEAVKAYRPETKSMSSGQVLKEPYEAQKAKLVLQEMADLLVLSLVDKGLVTDQITVTIGYDAENLKNPKIRKDYRGEIAKDRYGRNVPRHSHGTINLGEHTSSTKKIMEAASKLFDRIADKRLLIRRLNISANNCVSEEESRREAHYEQLDLFTDYDAANDERERERIELEREKKLQHAALSIKKKFGKNAIFRGMNLEEGATARERGSQIGGHRA